MRARVLIVFLSLISISSSIMSPSSYADITLSIYMPILVGDVLDWIPIGGSI